MYVYLRLFIQIALVVMPSVLRFSHDLVIIKIIKDPTAAAIPFALLAKWFDLRGKPLRFSLNQGAAQCRHVSAARAAGDVSQARLGPR